MRNLIPLSYLTEAQKTASSYLAYLGLKTGDRGKQEGWECPKVEKNYRPAPLKYNIV